VKGSDIEGVTKEWEGVCGITLWNENFQYWKHCEAQLFLIKKRKKMHMC